MVLFRDFLVVCCFFGGKEGVESRAFLCLGFLCGCFCLFFCLLLTLCKTKINAISLARPFWNMLEADKLTEEHERWLPLLPILTSMYFVPTFFLFIKYKYVILTIALQLLAGLSCKTQKCSSFDFYHWT